MGFLFLVVHFRLSAPAPAPAASSHTTYSHTICSHTTYSQTTCPDTTCPHTTYPHTTCHHTTYPHTTCQHGCVVTWTCTLRGRRGTYGTGLAPVARLGLVWRRGRRRRLRGRRDTWRHRPSLCVALRGVHGTSRHGSSLCVAGVELMALGWLR